MQTHYRVSTPRKKSRATGNHSPQHADKGPGSPSSKLGDITPPGSPVPICREYFPPSLENMLQKTLLYKTTFCSAWLGNEKCEFGAGCLFAHGQEELETTQGNIERVRKSMELILASKEGKVRTEGKLPTNPSRIAPACPPLLSCPIASPQSIAGLYDQRNYLLYNGHNNRTSWSPKQPPVIVSNTQFYHHMHYDETEEHRDPDEDSQIVTSSPATWTEYQAMQQHEDGEEIPAEEDARNVIRLTHPRVVRVTANQNKACFRTLLEACEDKAVVTLDGETPNPPSRAPSPSPKDDPTKLFSPISHSIDLDAEVKRYLQWEKKSESKTNEPSEETSITNKSPRAPAWCSGKGILKHWKAKSSLWKKTPRANNQTDVPLKENNAEYEPLWCNNLFDEFYDENISWIWCDTFPVIDREGKEDARVDFDTLSPFSTTIWTFTTAEQLEIELLLPPSPLPRTNEVGERALTQTDAEEHYALTSYLNVAKQDPKKFACARPSRREWCYTFLGSDDFQPTRYDLILDWLGKVSIPDICIHQF